jgi:integrase
MLQVRESWLRSDTFALQIITAAYTGLRWGELAGLAWTNTHLRHNPRIEIDIKTGALHEVHGRLRLGPPKTPTSVRTVHLPPFLADLLVEHRERNPTTKFVFTGPDGALPRRSNFRRRHWLPALLGDPARDWAPIQPTMHFHDLRHTKNLADRRRRPSRASTRTQGHRPIGTSDRHSHVTRPMIDHVLDALQKRWDNDGTWEWANLGDPSVVTTPCPSLLPQQQNGLLMMITSRPSPCLNPGWAILGSNQ